MRRENKMIMRREEGRMRRRMRRNEEKNEKR
jgi:hypothetical protein